MALIVGTVHAVEESGDVVIQCDSAEEVILSASALHALAAPVLRAGDRVRLAMRDGNVRSVTRLTGGQLPAATGPAGQQPALIQARVAWADRRAGIVHLQTGEGIAEFRPAGLSDQQWQSLRAGARITLRRLPDGTTTLELPQDEGSSSSRAVVSLAASPWQTGAVESLAAYLGAVRSDDGGAYEFVASTYAHLSLGERDRVQFQADEATRRITALNLVARAMRGRGWDDPCGAPPDELYGLSERAAFHQLVSHFCSEARLSWYWVVPPIEPKSEPASKHLSEPVIRAIQHAVPGFDRLFTHQIRALEAIRRGRNVMVLTPTASGKTYCYNPAVFSTLRDDPAARALYVFPLNALLTDQLHKLEDISAGMGQQGADIRLAKLVGGMESDERSAILKDPPNILAANPEMLSYLLSYGLDRTPAFRVCDFLANLRYVVLDEAHMYRSLLGMHMAGLIRRLLIACRRNGNPGPQFILSSATIGDAQSLAEKLTTIGVDRFEVIAEQDSGAAQPLRHWMMLDPYAGQPDDARTAHLDQAAEALADVLTLPDEDLNAILFVRSYRELRHVYAAVVSHLRDRGRAGLVDQVAQYAGGLLDSDHKEDIYRRLKDRRSDRPLRAVVATNALEAGIDLGALDVCILAGFPFQAMRMRQMAGRAGRRKEGAVIFVPDLTRSIDRYYADQPARLITQPPEVFVVDADNPYIARKHVVAAAASMSGGIKDEELKLFGRAADRMAAEAMQAGVLQRNGSSYTARAPARGGIWSVDRIRGNEQDPYVLCRAPDAERQRCGGACLENGRNKKESDERCEHFVQLLDRQYIYREAHPGAVFESAERGSLYRCHSLDDKRKVVIVAPLPDETRERTFPVEEVRVEILATREQRELANGAQLAWGDVKVTRSYAGYGAYDLIPRRRCRRCHASFPDGVKRCRSCGAATQPYFEHSQPAFRDFPAPHTGQVFTLEMETIACWLMLPAGLEDRLQAVAPCPIRSPDNRVAAFLRADPPFSSAASLARAAGIEPPEAEAAWEYYQRWAPVTRQPPPAEDVALIHPAVYGQCLCHHLRRRAPEAQALTAFAQATGYPAVQDERHICRRCYGGVLLLAAHTLEHIVSLNYPIVAVGDSQDIGSTTTVLHPQTRQTTAMWFDAYEGGIGAAEKMYSHFELLIEKSRASLACKCQSDKGCPVCVELPRCDRDNAALSKAAAVGLAEALLGRGEYIPEEPLYLPREAAEADASRAEHSQRAKGKVNRPGESAGAAGSDAYQLLCVQKHVHDAVLARALEVRAEEATQESPPLLISDLQAAYERIQAAPRPGKWSFNPAWTPYETLHIQPTASTRLTRSAYLTIVKVVHPDHNQDKSWSTAATQAVNRAWEIIRTERQQKS